MTPQKPGCVPLSVTEPGLMPQMSSEPDSSRRSRLMVMLALSLGLGVMPEVVLRSCTTCPEGHS